MRSHPVINRETSFSSTFSAYFENELFITLPVRSIYRVRYKLFYAKMHQVLRV